MRGSDSHTEAASAAVEKKTVKRDEKI